jgi:hypothetical protein
MVDWSQNGKRKSGMKSKLSVQYGSIVAGLVMELMKGNLKRALSVYYNA